MIRPKEVAEVMSSWPSVMVDAPVGRSLART